ncbi:MAG: NYN domain-containing protein [Candidatus Eisenbacteria bacterium]|nr:NYN domain-containing protein [Candidatus Eisenbacteria bacterium]MCC7144144.1 NYN domain-containing protein [Candidatus Eisenbacteria bacterium]
MRAPRQQSRGEVSRPADFQWIVDGHNAIFAVPGWERLQLEGKKREARQRLERRLEEFGRAIGRQVWVVYDGNHMERNPDAIDRTHLRSIYALPPEEADDRIRFLAEGLARAGTGAVVVTSDRRTLASTLPNGTRWMDVRAFLRDVVDPAMIEPEKSDPRGFADIERYFLDAAGEEPEGDGRAGT